MVMNPQAKRGRGAGERAAILSAAVSMLAAGCEAESNVYAPPPPPEVIVATPAEREVVEYVTYTGVAEASETVELRARVEGFLDEIRFRPGQHVAAGDVLFVLDKRQYEAAVEQAEASVHVQEAALIGAENDAKLARELADQRAGPQIDAIIKAAKRDEIKAALELARAKLVQAKLDLSYCDVTAPIGGRVTRNLVDRGNLVGRAMPTLLATIVQAKPAYVSVDVSESDVLRIRRETRSGGAAGREPGQVAPDEWQPCELALADDTAFATKGRVDYVAPEVDRQTGTLRVRTVYENADEKLVPGLFSRVRFPIASRRAMLVPDAALLSDQQGRYAMVVNDEDTVELRRVEVGILDGSMRVVESGLDPDDRVIVLGVLKARPGAKVTPKTEPAAQAAR
jgi:RND family efflux transporter MFP subunit